MSLCFCVCNFFFLKYFFFLSLFFVWLQSREMDKLLGWGKGVGKQIRIRIVIANLFKGKNSVLDRKFRVPLTLLMQQVSTKKRCTT